MGKIYHICRLFGILILLQTKSVLYSLSEYTNSTSHKLDVIIEKYGKIQHINQYNQHYDPMHYVLPFIRGEQGYHFNISQQKKKENKKVSCMQFYSYQLQIRNLKLITINDFGRLFQQYTVDMFAKIELERLLYFKSSEGQKSIRAELYSGLQDTLNNNDVTIIGKKMILPSTFIGGDRNKFQLCQDSMGLIRKYGKPDLFITITCNPNWPEILEIKKHQNLDRPDIIARVFKIKLDSFLQDLTKHHVLGKVVSFTYVVEFQKRGLPHAHILLILDEKDKLKSTNDYDKIISAELPSKKDIILYDCIVKNNIHGPCGKFNPDSPCMDKKKLFCTKNFPRTLNQHTIEDENGYPQYRRRDDGRRLKYGPNFIPNCWIVPYNPMLSRKYQCHINVEICSTIKSIKYLFKYIYKGPDQIEQTIQPSNNDEIKQYQDARYLSSSESCWRIFHYCLHQQYPAVVRLASHLENEQICYFRENISNEDLISVLEKSKQTTLTEWFVTNKHAFNKLKESNLNNNDIEFYQKTLQLKYLDFSDLYCWNKSKKKWTKRTQQNNTFSRAKLFWV